MTALTYGAIKKCSDFPSNLCGPNAACYESNLIFKEPFCKCNEGFLGTPPNCDGCFLHSACGAGAYCDALTYKCKEFCPFDEFCKNGMYCNQKNHICMDGCRFNSCPNGQHCDITTRKCIDGCKFGFNCDSSEICNKSTMKCSKGCSYKHDNCANDEFCNFNESKCQKGCAINGTKSISVDECKKLQEIQAIDKICADFCDECTLTGGLCKCNINIKSCNKAPPLFQQPIKPGEENAIAAATIAVLAG